MLYCSQVYTAPGLASTIQAEVGKEQGQLLLGLVISLLFFPE